MEHPRRKLNTALFWLYCAVMLWLLFDREGGLDGTPYWDQVRTHLSLDPFRTISLYAGLLDSPRHVLVRLAVINLGGNVILFIPLGFLLPRAFPRLGKFWKVFLTAALAITLVELAQLLSLLGICDIDDLILNLTGATLGYGIHKLIK